MGLGLGYYTGTTPRMTEGPKVFAVVVTFNGSPWIRKCIESLEKSSYPVHIIVIDNQSTDDTLRFLETRSALQYVVLKHNIGFGKANNLGIYMALEQGADYVFLLNQDAHIRPETVGKLVKRMSEDPALGILSPLHLNGRGDAIDPGFARFTLTRGAERFYSDLFFGRLESEKVYSIDFVNAAAWMVSVRCLHAVGGFDPLFHMYGEDDDYCRRVLQHGFQIGMLPGAVVCHARGKGDQVSRDRSARRTVAALYSREKSRSIVELKTPGNFLRVVALWYLGIFYSGMRAIINRNMHGLVVQMMIAVRLTMLLPRIYAHRRMSARPGPIWLSSPGTQLRRLG